MVTNKIGIGKRRHRKIQYRKNRYREKWVSEEIGIRKNRYQKITVSDKTGIRKSRYRKK